MNKNGLDLMADYVFLSKYSQRNDKGELETWEEVNERIYFTHKLKLESLGILDTEMIDMLNIAKDFENRKIILSSQRARQNAFPDSQAGILKHEAKIYNCCAT